MKDYKLTIHGQEFNVRVENINDASTEATVTVNGVEYVVEIEGAKNLVTSCTTKVRENMVVTSEPGIYIAGKFGVRIEDTVLITKFGCISLTESAKNYTII